MATAEEIQRNALAVLGTAVKTTPAGQKVDPNQLLYVLDAAGWGKVEPGGLLEMQSVHAALLERGVLPSDAALVCLLFQRREERLGIKVKLPAQVELLGAQQRIDLLAAVPKNASTGLTVVPVGGRPPAAQAPRVSAARLAPVTEAPKPAAAPPPPAPKPASNAPGLLSRLGISPGTLVLCALLLAVGGGVRFALREKLPARVDLPLPPVAAHLTVYKPEDGAYFYFYDPQKDFEESKARLDAMGAAVWPIIQKAGGERGYFCLKQEPQQCRAVKGVLRNGLVLYLLKKPPGAV